MRHLRPRGDIGNSAIGQICEHLRVHARKMDPFSLTFPYVAGVDFSRATGLHSATLQSKWTRSLAAYSANRAEVTRRS